MEGGLDLIFFSILWVCFCITIYEKRNLLFFVCILSFAQVLSNIWHIYYDEGDCLGSAYDCIFDSYEVTMTTFILLNTLLQGYYLNYRNFSIYVLLWIIFDIVWFCVGLSMQNWEVYNKYAVIITTIKTCALLREI